MTLDDLIRTISTSLHVAAIEPAKHHYAGLIAADRYILYVLLATAAVVGFAIGRRRGQRAGAHGAVGASQFPTFQNSGEALVSRAILSRFGAPNYHLMNHVTVRMDDGTTQIDHILLSRFGVFVIETKDYSGWIFASETGKTWTQVLSRRKFKFQNPLFQNHKHVRAVQGILDFLPTDAVRSMVIFAGSAEFKTETPTGVFGIGELVEYLSHQTTAVMSRNRMQFCVGRLETARLAISGQTDVEHVQSLEHRFRGGAAKQRVGTATGSPR